MIGSLEGSLEGCENTSDIVRGVNECLKHDDKESKDEISRIFLLPLNEVSSLHWNIALVIFKNYSTYCFPLVQSDQYIAQKIVAALPSTSFLNKTELP